MIEFPAVQHYSPDYPYLLGNIDDPPEQIFFAGDLTALRAPSVAVVGARRCTAEGRETARRFARHLAECGVAVVSGLAHGIDTAAHEGALAGGGATFAVLGSGVDRIYPARNATLAKRIVASGGALLSEYLPGTPPARHRFPERNRIISGLSRAVLVVEATNQSGSLITARMALEQGRDVLAVPGALSSPQSAGCLRLLREGAALVDSLETLRFELGLEEPQADAERAQPAVEQGLLAHFLEPIVTVDMLVARSGRPAAEVLAALQELELAGFVAANGGGYSRRPSD